MNFLNKLVLRDRVVHFLALGLLGVVVILRIIKPEFDRVGVNSISDNGNSFRSSTNTTITTTNDNDRVEEKEVQRQEIIEEVNCDTISSIEPINIGQMNEPNTSYYVSFSWWDKRLRRPQFKNRKIGRSNGSVGKIHQLLLQMPTTDYAFIDVGANVGFMTHLALSLQHPVYAIDPISYNIAKICEGYQANVVKGWIIDNNNNNSSILHLFHAAAGPTYDANITITRPSDEIGKFDQSSLSRTFIKQKHVVNETIPLLTIDSIIPENTKVGVVKVDVQGHEYGVFQGMTKLLSRTKNPIKYIFYEDSFDTQGVSKKLLEEKFNYTCTREDINDIICFK